MAGPRGISVGVCVFNDAPVLESRFRTLIFPALRAFAEPAEIICLDNSRAPSRALQKLIAECGFPGRYIWNGKNLRYAASVNRLVELAAYGTLVYLCPKHCEAGDVSWLPDLKAALWETENVALAGSLQPGPPEMPFPHVQGGIYAARTEVLRQVPFDRRFPHDLSDVWMSRRLTGLGYRLGSVDSVLSVHGKHPLASGPLPEGVKIRHVGRVRSAGTRWFRRLRFALRVPKQAIASFPKTH